MTLRGRKKYYPKVRVPDLPTRVVVAVERSTWVPELHVIPDPSQVPPDDRERVANSVNIALNVASVPVVRYLRFDVGAIEIPPNPFVEFYRDETDTLQARVIDRVPTVDEQLPYLRRKYPAIMVWLERERDIRRQMENRIAELEARLPQSQRAKEPKQ